MCGGWGLGVDWGWTPLPTRVWRYSECALRYKMSLSIEVHSSICLGDTIAKCCEGFHHFPENNINFGSVAPKRIKLQISTWAHFKELCLLLKMSPSRGHFVYL